MKRVLITGASGFVGHHVCEHILKNTDWHLTTIDRLSETTKNGFDRLREVNCYTNDRVTRFTHDLNQQIGEGLRKEIGVIDIIIDIASDSHVDRSIDTPVPFVLNNIKKTLTMLEYARTIKDLELFVNFSTDEVYGSAPKGVDYVEGDRHNPGNPYAASKSAQESLVRSYANTYKVPCIITNTMNIIGERQHPEKFLPLVINKVLKGELVTIHSDKAKKNAGTRFYLHARNLAAALTYIIENTKERLDPYDASLGNFNIVGEKELDNLEFAQLIARCVGKELKYEMVDFHSTRPGHDLRYALDGSKLEGMGFEFSVNLEDSLLKTVQWTMENEKWLR